MRIAGIEFRPVHGFEQYYEISADGAVFSKKSCRFSAQHVCKNGYSYVNLMNPVTGEKKSASVHRLVAFAWVEGFGECVNHKNENKLDNHADNLEWCSKAYNNTYNGKTQRCCKRVAKCDPVTHEVLEVYRSARIAERENAGTNYKNISAVCRGKRPRSGGFEWRFV